MRLLLLLLLITNSLLSQVTLKGFVKDTLQNPLTYANIVATPKGSVKNMVFTIADDIGYYKLNLNKDETYFLEISFVGFKTIKDTLSISKKTIKTYKLIPAINQLEAVHIDLPVLVKEDTIKYNIDKFTDKKERKLKNILKKLPGIEVFKNGNVTVLGKKVQGVLVDGKPFFGGGTKLAVENIPADAIKSIQALDNYNEIAFLKKVSDSDKMMLNVELKEDKKKFIFGDVEVKKGNDSFYDGHTNLYYYSKKMNINCIANSNNVNRDVFSFKDFMKFNEVNFNDVFQNLKNNSLSFSSLSVLDNIYKSKQHFGALNLQNEFSDAMTSSAYLIYSNKNQQQFTEQTNNYINFKEESNTHFNTGLDYLTGKISLKYNPNLNKVWDFKTKLDFVTNDYENTVDSKFQNFEVNVNNKQNTNTNKFNQIVEFHRDYDNHILSAITSYTYKYDSPFSEWLYSKVLLGENHLYQKKMTKDYNFATIFKQFWLINKDNHFHATIGNSYKESFYHTVNKVSRNDLKFRFNDFFAGSKYHVRLGKTSLKLGIDYHYYSWTINRNKNQKSLWLPNLKIKTKFTSSKELNLDYVMKSTLANVDKFADNPIYRSYNSFFLGNSNVENELYHNLNIYYKRFNIYRGVNFNLRLRYIKKDKGYGNLIEGKNYSRLFKFTSFKNLSENLYLNSHFSKKIKKIRYNFSLSVSNSKFLQFVDEEKLVNRNQSFSYNLYLRTSRFNPSISFGFKQRFNSFRVKNSLSKFRTNVPFFEFEYTFLEDFSLELNYEYHDYINDNLNQKNNYQLAFFDLIYHKENSSWTFDCKISNIFNSQFKQENGFSNSVISDTKKYIMPRTFLLGLSYKL